MPDEVIPNPEILETIERRPCEHEVFLAFNSDWHAEAFHDWWGKEGLLAFKEFAKANKGEYRF